MKTDSCGGRAPGKKKDAVNGGGDEQMDEGGKAELDG